MYSNAFFNPSSSYGWDPGRSGVDNYYDTPANMYFQEPDQQEGTFMRWLTNQGAGGYGRRDLFGKSLFRQATQGYEAATQTNPSLLFRDYLSGLGTNFVQNMWSGLTPEQRGESPQRYAGPVRWMSRG